MENKRLFIVIGSLIGILALSIGIPLLLLSDTAPDQTFSAAGQRDNLIRPIPTRGTTPALAASVPENNCTYPLEFWRSKPTDWPEHVTVGEVTYSREEMREIFMVADEDPAIDLLKHLYTTFLNILHGADMTSVEEVILDANTWLSLNPPGSPLSEFNQRRGVELVSLLEGYNNGVFGPGACPDIPITEELLAEGEPSGLPSIAQITPDPQAAGEPTPVDTVVVQPVQPSSPTSPPQPTSPLPPPTNTSEPAVPVVPTTAPSPTNLPPPTNPPLPTRSQPTNTLVPTLPSTHTPVPTLPSTNTPVPTLPPPTNTPVPTLPPPTNTPVPTLPPPTATAPPPQDGTCTGTIGAVTLDELTVPAGATCTLNGTRIEGSVDVEGGATLVANGITVTGNLRGRSASRVEVLSGSFISGNLRIENGGSARVFGSRIDGNLIFESNGSGVDASGNQVGGNVEVEENTGGVVISNNSISGNLKCVDNSPPPTGGGNTVGGNAEDQCANLN